LIFKILEIIMAGMRTEMVKQELIRYIADNQLASGKKIPSQDELRLKLNVGSATISSAIKALAEDGVLDIRDKVGAFVKGDHLDGHTGRNIAIVVNESQSTYSQILVSYFQQYLQKNNCQSMVFANTGGGDGKLLKSYPGLLRNIKSGHISAVIFAGRVYDSEYKLLDNDEIKYVSTLKINDEHASCYIDYKSYIEAAFDLLIEQGIKKPMVISKGYKPNELLKNAFCENLQRLNTQFDWEELFVLSHSFLHSREIVEALLKQSPAERPDALIFTGDVVMQGVAAWLLRLQAGVTNKYLPVSTTILNKQNPVMPVLENITIFEFDIFTQVKIATDSLLLALKTNSDVVTHKIVSKAVNLEKYCENSIAN